MTGSLNFWDYQTWSFVVVLSVLSGGMLLANLLRRLIRPLRRSLIPSSVLAGFLVLAAMKVFEAIFGRAMFDGSVL